MKLYLSELMARLSWRIVLLFGLFLLPLILFAEVADSVSEGEHVWIDKAVLRSIHGISNPILDAVIPSITAIGGPNISTVIIAITVAVLFYKKYWWHAIFLCIGVGGAALANLVLKSLFQRARPDLWEWIITESNYSFPSGHAMASVAIVVCALFMLWHTKWRTLCIVTGVMYVLVIGFTRLYLGVHYPSDILGGWAAGAAWVVIVYITLTHYWPRPNVKRGVTLE